MCSFLCESWIITLQLEYVKKGSSTEGAPKGGIFNTVSYAGKNCTQIDLQTAATPLAILFINQTFTPVLPVPMVS